MTNDEVKDQLERNAARSLYDYLQQFPQSKREIELQRIMIAAGRRAGEKEVKRILSLGS